MASVPSLGTNLDGAAYYTTDFPYIDLMRQAAEWVPQSPSSSQFNTGATLDLDSSGWVTSLPAGTWAGIYPILHNPLGADLAGQRYVVMYDGDGTFQGGLSSTISEASPGRFVLTSAWDGTLGFQITSTNPADYVRDIHVVREDQLAYFEAGIDFNPQFLAKVEDFHTFRFMDWMNTNTVYDAKGVVPWPDSAHAANIEWVDRPLMTDAMWDKGVPVEAMVEICNLAGADGWFNMPVNASDDYVRQFATYVRDHLNPGLEIHVEFSNEVWNWAFVQSGYAYEHYADAGFDNWLEWYGVRTAQIGRIWNEVFGESPTGGEDATGRVHVVFNTQAAWQGLESYGLETQNWYENGVHVRASDYFDDYAVTGYTNFNTADHNVVRSWWSNPDGGFDAAVASLQQYVDGPLKAAYAYHAGKAAENGLELTTYESGYGEVAPGETADYQQFLIDVQRQPELYDIEKANYQNFKDAGGGLYMNFGIIGAPSGWGSWSALESLYQETSPRYEALTDWNATVAPWYETGRDPSVFDSSWTLHQNTGLIPTNNFNGDGHSDILWQSSNGTPAIWLMNGASAVSVGAAGSFDPGPSWHVKESGDFNGDGKSDILWQDDNGTPAIWLMNGSTLLANSPAGSFNPGPTWQIKATGDFNADGKSDILWQHDNGTPAIWLMNGSTVLANSAAGSFNPGPTWQIKATGDFNGDGKSDILWQNDNGTPAIWLMNGSTVLANSAAGSFNPGPTWQIKGTGDFNGDGRSDILWQNDNGTPAIWLMNGSTVLANSAVGPFNPGPTWHIKGTGDYNDDNKSDILWQHDNGTPAIWTMDGMNFLSGGAAGSFNPGSDWHVIA